MKEGRRALVVDDDPAIRRLVHANLASVGFSVHEASDGKEAMEYLAALKEKLDLICLDLVLPQASGFDVCEFLQRTETLRGVPVLVISARTSPHDRAQAEELGAVGYLCKPFRQKDLLTTVRALLPRRTITRNTRRVT